ncbi:NADH dehydrogenase subunit G, partial [human gut metagenome]
RYYKDYADGTDLGVYGAHDNVYFGRPEDGTLESEFSGNLVEICPTGVFTTKRTPSVTTVNGICSLRRASASYFF